MKITQARNELTKDIFFIFLGIIIAVVLSSSGWLDTILAFFGNGPVASFVAGFFFTSVFTIAPASVAFTHIASTTPVNEIILWGALGAVFGDLALFFFIRDRFFDDLKRSIRPSFTRRFLATFHLGFLRWISPVLGAVLIASPLPDEIGLALLGISKVRMVYIVPVTFAMNMIGIYSILWFVSILQ